MAWPSSPIHGKLARITADATVIDHTSRWSINYTKDAAVFGRQGQEFKQSAPGQAGWTGSAEFFFVNSSHQSSFVGKVFKASSSYSLTTTVDVANMEFCFDTTANHLTGDIIITGVTIDAPVGDMIRASFTFQGSGPIILNA